MHSGKYTVFLLMVVAVTGGCIFDTGSEGAKDSGTYTIGSNMTIARSYPGGGRL